VVLRSTGSDAGEWAIVVQNGVCTVTAGPAQSPDLSIEATSQVWASLISKKLDAGWAYMSGQLRISGDVSLAMRLQALLPF
jgi:putative sterol carrier protein